jgi:GT2 family glycosyltransferase
MRAGARRPNLCDIEETPPKLAESGISLSIVIYKTPLEQVKNAIQSAFAALRVVALEADSRITVVDNGDDSTRNWEYLSPLSEELERFGCRLDYIYGHGNIGYGAAHNLAFERDHRPLHVFMNADVELDPKVFMHGCAYFKDNADVAMICPKGFDDSGNRQFLCKRYPTVFDLFVRGFAPGFIKALFSRRLAYYEMRELSEKTANKDISIISGCFMFCRSSTIQKVNGFDPSFFLYFEDFDLSLRVNRKARLAYLPDMKIKHSGGNSARKGVSHILMFLRSARRFFSLHGWRWI